MYSVGYYVRKGIRLSFQFYSKHFLTLFITFIIEITRFITTPFVFLTPVFSKMQYNFNKVLLETKEAIYTKSFDDADAKPSYLTRLIYFSVSFFLSLVAGFSLFAIVVALFFLTRFIILQYAATYLELITNIFNIFIVFFLILGIVIVFFCFICSYVGGFICCASKDLSLGDVFYNAIATMKKFGGKIVLANVLYLLFVSSYVFIFGLPIIILYAILWEKSAKLFITIAIIFGVIIVVGLIILIPFFFTSYRLTMHMMLDKCADLTKKVILIQKDKESEPQELVFTNEEKAKTKEVDINHIRRFGKDK